MGSDADIWALCGPDTEVIDGSGLVVTPGLTDSHSHWLWGAEQIDHLDFSDCRTTDAMRAKVEAACARTPPGEWIRGNFLEYSAFLDGRAHRRLLDDVSPNHPVYLIFYDIHSAVVNSAGLQRAGIAESQPLPGGEVVGDEDGPTGLLLEFPAMELVTRSWPAPTQAEVRSRWRRTLSMLSSLGITGAHMMNGRLDTLEVFGELEASGELSLRIDSTFDLVPTMTDDDVHAFLPHLDDAGHLWRAGAVKLWLDGVIESGTAWLRSPDHHGDGTAPLWVPAERYARYVELFADAGFRVTTHAIGDQAVAFALDTYARIPSSERQRHRIEHLEVTSEADVARMGAQGVVASVQPQHMMYVRSDRSDAWSRRVGADRVARAWRLRDLVDAGSLMVLGSDWPTAPVDPRVGLAWAQLRRPASQPEEPVIGVPGQELTGAEAFAGYTTNAAWVTGSQHERGRLRRGSVADFVAWTDDPVTVNPTRLQSVEARLTVVDGRVSFRAG